jgi:hypothetical protein
MRMRNFSGGVLMLAVLWMGAAQAHNTPQEEANKKLVRDFYNALDDAQMEGKIREKIAGIIEKYKDTLQPIGRMHAWVQCLAMMVK